jgi:hypothetical protein
MTLSGIRSGQHDEELEPFIGLLRAHGVRSYLEIGARQGDTFARVLEGLAAGPARIQVRGVAVDLPGGPWGVTSSEGPLHNCIQVLCARGFDAQMVLGDVAKPSVVETIRKLAPFDAIFIDADHRYESVQRDFLAFNDLAPIVAFHDIASGGVQHHGMTADVERFWRELRKHVAELHAGGASRGAEFFEFVHKHPTRPMGIGVIVQS